LKRNYQNLPESGVLVWAHKQTKGRGQGTHEWLSEPGGLYFSLLLDPDFDVIQPVDLLVCFAEHFIGFASRKWGICPWLKPPNDVWVENRKLMGILIENSFLGRKLEYCIMGVGINVNQSFAGRGLDFPAVSLRELIGTPVDLEPFLCELLQEWDNSRLNGK
jgi:BirA family biotin operon repressor/biotin-[acetyl-CoA-carboxylase] ligase